MKAFKRMQSSPQMIRGDGGTDKKALFRDSAGDNEFKRQKTFTRMASTHNDSSASLRLKKSHVDVAGDQNATLIKKISLSGPEIRRMVAMKAAMAANLRSKKLRSVS